MRPESAAFLLDSAPKHWDTRNEFHLRLCRGLIALGVKPVTAFSHDLPDAMRERYRAAGAEVVALNYADGWSPYLADLGRLVNKYSIGQVHIRFFDYFSAVPWMARLRGVRHILFTEANSGEWKSTSWKAHLVRLRARVACRPLTRVIAISEFIKTRLICLGVEEDRITVVYNGVDTDRFRPDPAARLRLCESVPVEPGEFLLTTAATLLPWKHNDVTLKACSLLKLRGVPFRLFIAGEGPLREELQTLSQELGIADRVYWLGQYPWPERLFQACDVFVLSSTGEAFGNVLAEAMACGAPVVGSDSGAIGEIVENGVTGSLTEPLSPTRLADALQDLAADPARRREMGRRGLERVRERFAMDIAVRQTIGVYEDIWQS